MNVQSRSLNPQNAYDQWCLLFQQHYQLLHGQYQQQQKANTLVRYSKGLHRKIEALEWIGGEFDIYTGPQNYPAFRRQCEYTLEHFTRHSLRRSVEEVLQTLHNKLAIWVEAQFDTQYRYELRENPTYDGTWLIWDRQTKALAQHQGRAFAPLSHQQARRWSAGLNGLAFCPGDNCKRWTPHECLPSDIIRCLVCRAERPIRSGD